MVIGYAASYFASRRRLVMKKLLFAAMVAGLAVSAEAQTTFTQVWSIKTDVGGGPAWF